jgi:NAD+ synthase (glutamine-hydrolysing)
MPAGRADQPPELPFTSLYRHGFVRVAVAVPRVHIVDPADNGQRTLALARQAADRHAVLVVFPELGLSSYSAEDLFHQDAVQDAVDTALDDVVTASREIAATMVVGAPMRVDDRLFNTAVVIHHGRALGVVPKSYLPNYREYYEKRQFAAARDAVSDEVTVAGRTVPFGSDVVFEAANVAGFAFHVEICEDLWTPIPPSTFAALGGATVLVNMSASNIVVAKADYRHQLCDSQSARCIAAYLYAAAGQGESTTDLAWDGHALVYENGELLAETERFADREQLVTADVDLARLGADRMRMTSFSDSAHDHRDRIRGLRRVSFEVAVPGQPVPLRRSVGRFPFVPSDPARRNERCAEVYHIQVEGLTSRLAATGIDTLVIGISGGLDSTQALVVAAKTMDGLGLPRTNIVACTMPGFGTTARTLGNARALMAALGVEAHEIDIRPSSRLMLEDIGHPAANGAPVYDITYENVQAGERTSHLFRLANRRHGLVVGTGDLSELALGWSTYGVGDQMSHYNVNASVPKTLIQYLIRWEIDSGELGTDADAVLASIVDTEISPELVPVDATADQPAQVSEAVVGPYELQDFHLYYLLRFGYRPSRVAYLAHHAWGDAARGAWPDLVPPERRREYDMVAIKRWLRVFLVRFFETSQFKRSALPNGPKVGSGGSLSPRGDWRAPSDSTARVWLDELERNVPA